MARLHEFQGKALLAKHGIVIPRGGPAHSPAQACEVAASLGCETVVKIQAWTTGRAAMGGVCFAKNPKEAGDAATRMLGMMVGQFPVESVIVEEKISFVKELFLSFSIDDRARAPVMLLAASGGTGIEERAASVSRIPCSVSSGPDRALLSEAIAKLELTSSAAQGVAKVVETVFSIARTYDARSVEINPLAILADGRVVAADCRMTIDDYAVFRQPELGIEIAREFDHPPTALEKVAYAVEQADHRGTFYFAQLATVANDATRGLAGFHGAGGGGSMMSMDALVAERFTIADFTDTSGNPSAAKVYRASRVILSQPGLCGYFGSGSGVANQEQFWSAYGLAKAFWELDLDIPAVIRLGGNGEERAISVLHECAKGLRATVEGYGKSDPPAAIAHRFGQLSDEAKAQWQPRAPRRPSFVGREDAVSLPISGGRVWIDPSLWRKNASVICAHASGLLIDDAGRPTRTVDETAFAAKDSELIACEVECRAIGCDGLFVELDIPGLDAACATMAMTMAKGSAR
ncbi:MAG: acetate--CoA ligase family protein [Planctomycetota bacterium]|nr:acetate--CoA ligase family protein [Planctomycetota bacterium]